ncbi:SDR family oxidoreductase [Burkholderia gladioli]|uniref:SDR family oxidoreductase n=1 Tax=Burkholderia gladioli TaxID=28095 RepID=UPI003D1A39F3
MFDHVERELGPLDALVNNAGIVAAPQPLAEMELTRLTRMFEVNVLGAYLCAREAARRLPTDRGVAAAARSSMSPRWPRGSARRTNMSTTPAPRAPSTRSRWAWPRNSRHTAVRVNAVRPGLIDTEIHASGGQPDRAARLGAQTPIGRRAAPTRVAEAIVWLLGDAASYVTGTLVDVGGGR